MNNEQLIEILQRDAAHFFSLEGLKSKLEKNIPLKIKMGADPSRPDLHLGHSVVLRKLKLFQEMGHEVIFVIGDFTGMIGDPTGRSKTRPSLSLEETRKSGESYYHQVCKILDPQKTRIVYNSEWLNKMNFSDVISLASKYTVARVLERNDFSVRFSNNQPISIHELLYPLVQGYDSVVLQADIEVGGTDQLFNLLVGKELQKDYNVSIQEVITFPLLVGLDGTEKMSKSLNNYIGIDEPAPVMFEKSMKIPDELLLDYFRFTTDIPLTSAKNLVETDIRQAHFVYAREIVKMYHNENDALNAENRYLSVASGATPEVITTHEFPKKPLSLVDALVATQLAPSKAQARRLIEGDGIKINQQKQNDCNFVFQTFEDVVIQKGKNVFVKICFTSS